jgi:hypothetical protein
MPRGREAPGYLTVYLIHPSLALALEGGQSLKGWRRAEAVP